MPPSSPIAYRPEIDGLRAIAIASVVLFHAGSSWFPGGYVGVDVFFVISGYLITSIIVKEQAEGRFSYWRFYARRARRILPALFFMLTVVTALRFAILLPDGLIQYGKLLIYTVIFGANFRLAAEPRQCPTVGNTIRRAISLDKAGREVICRIRERYLLASLVTRWSN